MTGPGGGADPSGADASAAARAVVARGTELGLTVATAESLTAGMVAAALADVPGASAVLQGGVVAYQNHVKADLLGVDAQLLAARGAVDPEVARQMAAGARRALRADVGVATTGVAGPEPHQGRSVGTVMLGLAVAPALAPALRALAAPAELSEDDEGAALGVELHLAGDRAAVRGGTVERAMTLLEALLAGVPGP
ncbi:CinA family protein [Micrococcus flavus]|uniref:Nicotinamide-nucleotide amidase n=1 Tax=Micrococcus flavus TaxID=384602 RepID=A0A4Y8X549_9MICC|nr:CinA family protein [Micrococcus flavus]MBB4883126.1 nicotinamide-nucleotide amidase [Micrococcus flavus]TFI04534.1 CinA family protein [Micrococcus flavus]GGK42611.1 competence damage-inducible protein A [Micrococcus flavus]